MTKIRYSSQSEKVRELEADLKMYKRHLEIDIQDELMTEEKVLKAIKLIDETEAELKYWKGAC